MVSFGTGHSEASDAPRQRGTGLYQMLRTVVKAATRTDETHHMLQDLLPASDVRYFRFDPPIDSGVGMDETDIGKLVALQAHGRAFVADGGAGAADMAKLAALLSE